MRHAWRERSLRPTIRITPAWRGREPRGKACRPCPHSGIHANTECFPNSPAGSATRAGQPGCQTKENLIVPEPLAEEAKKRTVV